MNFPQAVVSGIKNYCTSTGRASRSEYWYWTLFCSLGGGTCTLLDDVFLPVHYHGYAIHTLEVVFDLVTILPTFAVAMRRLHDIDRSGKWIYIGFTIIGAIFPLLIWNCQRGTEGDNRFGADPLSTRQRDATLSPSTSCALLCVLLGSFQTILQPHSFGLFLLIVGWFVLARDAYRSSKDGEVSAAVK